MTTKCLSSLEFIASNRAVTVIGGIAAAGFTRRRVRREIADIEHGPGAESSSRADGNAKLAYVYFENEPGQRAC